LTRPSSARTAVGVSAGITARPGWSQVFRPGVVAEWWAGERDETEADGGGVGRHLFDFRPSGSGVGGGRAGTTAMTGDDDSGGADGVKRRSDPASRQSSITRGVWLVRVGRAWAYPTQRRRSSSSGWAGRAIAPRTPPAAPALGPFSGPRLALAANSPPDHRGVHPASSVRPRRVIWRIGEIVPNTGGGRELRSERTREELVQAVQRGSHRTVESHAANPVQLVDPSL
jgi:hypothetical protein